MLLATFCLQQFLLEKFKASRIIADAQALAVPCKPGVMSEVTALELQAALQNYRESLAELDTLRQSGKNVVDTQEVRRCTCNFHDSWPCLNTRVMQVYDELLEAITLTEDALQSLQSTTQHISHQKTAKELNQSGLKEALQQHTAPRQVPF